MLLLEQRRGKMVSTPVKELRPDQVKSATSRLAASILDHLAAHPTYPKAVASALRVHEQKVYYHIRRLERCGLIEVLRAETVHGTAAQVYGLTRPAFALRFGKPVENPAPLIGAGPQAFLEPFVENGELRSTIIVGSPDPHGPDMARSRDGYYGIDLALWLGTFLSATTRLHVKLDTEAREEDLRSNLILIGGPVVNTVTRRFNSRFPVRFDPRRHYAVHSVLTKKTYHSDEIGVILKVKNPLNEKKSVLLIAGKRYPGTRAAILALLTRLPEIIAGNSARRDVMAKIVEGVDKDADGVVDAVNIVE